MTDPHPSLFDADLAPRAEVCVATERPRPPAAAPQRMGRRDRRPTLLAVDGNSLAHRAYHAYDQQAVVADGGRPRGAILGFLALLCGICDQVGPDAVVVGFDDRRHDRSRRRALYDEYKAQRPDKDPSLIQQLQDLHCLLQRLGVHVLRPDGEEADDVLGSAAATASAHGWQAVLATSDRDAYALVSDDVTLLRLGSGLDQARRMGPREVQRETGVPPSRYVELAALRGDSSDNLKGVDGIGAKRAAQLIRTVDHVERAADDPIACRSVLGARAGQALLDDLAHADSVFRRNVALMAIRRDLPVDLGAATARAEWDLLEHHLLIWELPTLVRRVQVALGVRPDLPPPPGDEDLPPVAVQPPPLAASSAARS